MTICSSSLFCKAKDALHVHIFLIINPFQLSIQVLVITVFIRHFSLSSTFNSYIKTATTATTETVPNMIKAIRDAANTAAFHYKEGNLNYPMMIYISLVHIVAFVGLLKLPNCSKETLIWAFTLWPIRYVKRKRCSLLKKPDQL